MYCKDPTLSMHCDDTICSVTILFIYCNDTFKMHCKDTVCTVTINARHFPIKLGKYPQYTFDYDLSVFNTIHKTCLLVACLTRRHYFTRKYMRYNQLSFIYYKT